MSAIFYEGEPVIAQRDHTQSGRIEFIQNDGRSYLLNISTNGLSLMSCGRWNGRPRKN